MDNEKIYKSLSPKEKQIVEMYLTARQFNNAVLEEEILIMPSSAFGNKEGIFKWGETKITVRGDKTIVKAYPYVVDKSFACEVYLKLLILLDRDFNCKKIGHNIFKLYSKTNDTFKADFLKVFKCKYGEKADEIFLQNEIRNISNVFVEWRYIYEKTDLEKRVNIGFLNAFCNYLDRYAQRKILEKLEYDVDKNMR